MEHLWYILVMATKQHVNVFGLLMRVPVALLCNDDTLRIKLVLLATRCIKYLRTLGEECLRVVTLAMVLHQKKA